MDHLSKTPEVGQLVDVRKRLWVVSNISKSTFSEKKSQHVVNLISIDDDSINETLDIVWEIEAGSRIIESAGLPNLTGWDSYDTLDAFLDSVRWAASVNADRSFMQAPFKSGIQIKDYQLDPLVRAIDMARVKMLIADDVGLGKTIEAGLVVQELIARHRARSVLIVCPASLQLKWQDEMSSRFGLDFKIVNTEYLKKLRRERGIQTNPWTSYPRLIASMDWMKSGEGLRLMKDCLPANQKYPRSFDILIVDEAHNVSPAGSPHDYAIPSLRTQLIRTISPHFEHRIFLSATPHNGNRQSFTALLELLDDQSCIRGVMPDEKTRKRIIVRRLKTDLPGFPSRELHALQIDYTNEEKHAHQLLVEYAKERKGSGPGTAFIQKLLKKRLFSSPRAFARTINKHKETVLGKTKKSKGILNERILRKALERAEEDYADDEKYEDALEDAVTAASDSEKSLTDNQKGILDKLIDWANNASMRKDSKADAVLNWLDEHLKDGEQINDKRVILFTEYRDTHSWLLEILANSGWGGSRIESLHGGTEPEDRERIKAAFQAHPSESELRILLATDAASEGIDLQNYCNYLIHIEIPWNPNVLEQRNGRIDRFGQKEGSVHIWHPIGSKLPKDAFNSDTNPGDLDGDLEFLWILAQKANKQREDLGSVAPVLIKQVDEAMLGERKSLNTIAADKKAEKAKRYLAIDREIKQKIERLHNQVLQTQKDLNLSPERVERAVKVGLQLANKSPLVEVTDKHNSHSPLFEVPHLVGSWEQATRGLIHPHNNKRRPITFDHQTAEGRDDVVLAHLGHKLVQMCLHLLRREIWSPRDISKMHRITVRKIPDSLSDSIQVIVWSRLIISGKKGHRLHEELTFAGGSLRADKFNRESKISTLEKMLEEAEVFEPDNDLFDLLKKQFEMNKQNVINAIAARSKDRLKYLLNTIDRRRSREEGHIDSLLSELQSMIEKELLESKKPEQLELHKDWASEERETLKKDLAILKERLESLPKEKADEKKSLRLRYEEPCERTFPVAIEFLVPESLIIQ